MALPSRHETLDGRTVTSLTLAPNSGDALVKTASTPPPSTTDTTGPTVTLTTTSGAGGTLAVSGAVSDGVAGGLAVVVAVRNEATGQWRRADGTWGVYTELAATVATPGGVSSSWSTSFSLPAGSYGVSVVATDAAGRGQEPRQAVEDGHRLLISWASPLRLVAKPGAPVAPPAGASGHCQDFAPRGQW